ncbi:hypothetical protein HJC23_005357 [Cyclotella cryptica]|uniref:Uncharacterized protein n=1 Tax=Cyclotella cryptica TaxID=29204 RepID=A0ABD3PDX3_9STRA|eukprot:CCRYP_015368-RA/>CCRYP_015368-RA protein AED:0.39 eAED:0.39 QI:0/-1/0/1/-1/1/1/0/266
MERNDSSIKEILDQISKDDAKAVVEEVRNIVLRDLGARGVNASTDEQPVQISHSQQPREEGHSSTATEHHTTPTPSNPSLNQKNVPDDDLAFTISKDSETYKNIFSMVQWYRDSSIVGSEFADRRSAERECHNSLDSEEKKFAEISNKIFNRNANYKSLVESGDVYPKASDFTGTGHPLLAGLAESYIKSPHAIDVLRPSTIWLASKDGPLLQAATQSLANTIPLFQSTADSVMRRNVLWLLQDQGWREWAKSITTRFVDRSHKDE